MTTSTFSVCLTSVRLRVPRAKTRLHPINPLSAGVLLPPARLDWPALLSDTTLPLHVDIGCAYGELALLLAEHGDARLNRIGLDLRDRPLARASAVAGALAVRLGRRSVAFALANARHPRFLDVLDGYPGPLACVSVLFPDPWGSRARPGQSVRRLLQPDLVDAVAARMPAGGHFVVATDNAELAAEMRAPFVERPDCWADTGLSCSPFAPLLTAWQSTIEGRKSPCYWSQYERRPAAADSTAAE